MEGMSLGGATGQGRDTGYGSGQGQGYNTGELAMSVTKPVTACLC